MDKFAVHYLRVTAEVETAVVLNEHKGSAIRGALFHALRGPNRPGRDGYTGYCTNKAAPSCWECALHHVCPVSTLVATLDDQPKRGRNVPRPYIIRARHDAEQTTYRPGDLLSFNLGLCADALTLFPYVVLALERLAHEGLGKKCPENDWQRGKLRIVSIAAIHPLTGEAEVIRQAGSKMVQVPDLPATHADVLHAAGVLADCEQLTLRFRTPTRLIAQKKTLKEPVFRDLFLRLITRLEQLSSQFSDSPLELDVRTLVRQAEQVQLVSNHTHWVDLRGYSTRRRSETRLGGLMGHATYQADDWRPFLPWLIWGSLLGVGKNTVKGDGWYDIEKGRREKEEGRSGRYA